MGVCAIVIAYDRFVGILAEEFEISKGNLTRETRFVDDLAFDSFQFFRLAVLIEMLLPGAEVPIDVVLDSLTVGDVYSFYAVQAAERQTGF